MPSGSSEGQAADRPAAVWYRYAIVRVVPRVERGECINVGVIVFARERRFLAARVELDVDRLRALAPEIDVERVQRHLRAFVSIGQGQDTGGPLAALPLPERFHWLTAPRSTVIQTSAVHEGVCADPLVATEELLDAYVR